MRKNEKTWDKLLKIKTTGRDDSKSDQYNYPYEPTPYLVLEQLANSGLIRKNDVILDYGCGKGRVDFFFSYQTRVKSIGIEYDERIYSVATENQKTAISAGRVCFLKQNSEEYISYLMTVGELEFMDEIDCRDLFDEDNQRERIMIFQMFY